MQVAVIGDSIVHGGIDDEMGGWVNRMKIVSMTQGQGDHVFNLGIGGNNSRDILERADAEIKARVNHVKNVIFSTGTNDMNIKMSLDEFKKNLTELGRIAASYDKKVYFMELFLRVGDFTPDDTAAYNTVINEVCQEGGYTYIPTLDLIIEDDLIDTCHPGPSGHIKLCERVSEYMKD